MKLRENRVRGKMNGERKMTGKKRREKEKVNLREGRKSEVR